MGYPSPHILQIPPASLFCSKLRDLCQCCLIYSVVVTDRGLGFLLLEPLPMPLEPHILRARRWVDGTVAKRPAKKCEKKNSAIVQCYIYKYILNVCNYWRYQLCRFPPPCCPEESFLSIRSNGSIVSILRGIIFVVSPFLFYLVLVGTRFICVLYFAGFVRQNHPH